MQTSKLREALEALVEVVETWEDHLPSAIRDGELSKALEMSNSALSEPPRNCDVGTPAEQTERLERHSARFDRNEDVCVGCPLINTDGCCELVWAQVPYES